MGLIAVSVILSIVVKRFRLMPPTGACRPLAVRRALEKQTLAGFADGRNRTFHDQFWRELLFRHAGLPQSPIPVFFRELHVFRIARTALGA